jgi:hypothetical protein
MTNNIQLRLKQTEAAFASATSEQLKLLGEIERMPAQFAATLRGHWLTGIKCDEVTGTDTATCFCTVWRSEPKPNVGDAVEAWIAHVLTFINHSHG